jgi:hypothetical protein
MVEVISHDLCSSFIDAHAASMATSAEDWELCLLQAMDFCIKCG